MPFIPAPNIIEVEFRYLLFSQQCENRVMVDNLGTVDAAALEAVAVAAWNWWELTYSPLISVACSLREVVATDLTADDGGQFTYAPDATTAGTVEGEVMPNEVSFCIGLRSAARGRSARGRWFVAGLPHSHLATANELSNTSVSAFLSALGALRTVITGLSKDLVVVSYRHGGVVRPGGPVFYPVTHVAASDNVVDSQRRRRPGIGI